MAIALSDELFNKTINLYLDDAVKRLKGGANAFNIGSDVHQGLKTTEGFFGGISDMIEDRDITSSDAQTPTDIGTSTQTAVSYLWKTKLLQAKVSEVKRFTGGKNSEDALTLFFAKEYAAAIVKSMYEIGLGAAVAAIKNQTNLVNGDGTASFEYTELNKQLSLFGDASQSLSTIAMRGLEYHTLIGDASTSKAVENVMGATIVGGDASMFGRGSLVYDAQTLRDESDADNIKAYVLSLVANSISLLESENREYFMDKVGTNENIMYQFKFEGGFDVGLAGYTYDSAAGNTKADILTSANWSKVANVSDKLTAGTLGIYSN